MNFLCMILSQIFSMLFRYVRLTSIPNFRIFKHPKGVQVAKIKLLDVGPKPNAYFLRELKNRGMGKQASEKYRLIING